MGSQRNRLIIITFLIVLFVFFLFCFFGGIGV